MDVTSILVLLVSVFAAARCQQQENVGQGDDIDSRYAIDAKANPFGPDYITSEGVDIRKENSIYAAIEHMKPLVEIERRLVNIISKDFLQRQIDRRTEFSAFAVSVQEFAQFALEYDDDLETYLGNPINCYMIIKRFTNGWLMLPARGDLEEDARRDVQGVLDNNYMYMPTAVVDLLGAQAALIRLMDSYDITTHELTEGMIPGIEPSIHKLTAKDCHDISDVAHKSRRYVRMKQWSQEAAKLVNDESHPLRHGNVTRAQIYMYMSWCSYLEGDLKEALRYTKLVLVDEPNNPEALENVPVYSWYVDNNLPCTFKETGYMKSAQDVLDMMQMSTYTKTCKRKVHKVMDIKDHNNLRCFYKNDHPHLYLRPMRVTQHHDNPEVYVLHDVLRETRLQKLINHVKNRLTVAEVINPIDGSRMTAPYRVAKSCFMMPGFEDHFPGDTRIENEYSPIFGTATGLNMATAEGLQLNNYGLGGQYEFHHDYGLPGATMPNGHHGNRIATALLYMSDVEAGGETVFTEIGLSVPPEKGSILFWYNLHRNGSVFKNTKHASCPVLSGSKWVANKWIHEFGNEFTRRCSLDQFE